MEPTNAPEAEGSASNTNPQSGKDTSVTFDVDPSTDIPRRRSIHRQLSTVSSSTSTSLPSVGEDGIDGILLLDKNHKHDLPSHNEFGSRKVIAHAMMDAALFMANISQLRMLIASKSTNIMFFTPLLSLIIASISCQVIFAFLILFIWARENREEGSDVNGNSLKQAKGFADGTTQKAHVTSVVMVFLIVVTNMFITGLGIEPANCDVSTESKD